MQNTQSLILETTEAQRAIEIGVSVTISIVNCIQTVAGIISTQLTSLHGNYCYDIIDIRVWFYYTLEILHYMKLF